MARRESTVKAAMLLVGWMTLQTVVGRVAWAQEAVQSSAEEQAVRQLSEQLSRNRDATAAKRSQIVGNDFETKQKQLLAEEEALLKQLTEASVTESQPVSLKEPEEKASVDLQKAVVAEPAAQPRSVEGSIEVVKPTPMPRETVKTATLLDQTKREMEKQAEAANRQASSLRDSNAQLRRQVDTLQNKNAGMARELDETRNRLIIAETEVERLSKVIDDLNQRNLERLGGKPQRAAVSQPPRAVTRSFTPQQQEKATEDMPVATVTVEKAHLRTGPSKDNSPLMTVLRGTRLAIETRKGSWYRVISPTGVRAWISSDVVSFGSTPDSGPTRTIRIRGFDSSLEDEASAIAQQAD